MRRSKSFKECNYCNKPSILIMVAPDDQSWTSLTGLCNVHLFSDCVKHGMMEDGYDFLTHEEYDAVVSLHKF